MEIDHGRRQNREIQKEGQRRPKKVLVGSIKRRSHTVWPALKIWYYYSSAGRPNPFLLPTYNNCAILSLQYDVSLKERGETDF